MAFQQAANPNPESSAQAHEDSAEHRPPFPNPFTSADVNVEVIGIAPATSMGYLFLATSQALCNAAHSATQNMQEGWRLTQAATTREVAMLLDPEKLIVKTNIFA